MIKERISAMSDAHSEWLKALEFYKDDLNILKERLTEIAGKNTGKDAEAQMEHYENQLKVQLQNIDNLHHEILANLSKTAAQAQENTAGYVDAALIKADDLQKEAFTAIEKVINELRQDFNAFAAKWM